MYGPAQTSIEQINTGTGTVTYLHHDQAGSTRVITGSTGTAVGKCSYGAYGTPTCEGATTTPLGYDAQYTSSDTGLIYLRNRVYDPATAQFLTRGRLVTVTGQPYGYAGDTPVNESDPSGLGTLEAVLSGCAEEPEACAALGAAGLTGGVIAGRQATEEVLNTIQSGEGTYETDEGEAIVKQQAEEARRRQTEDACEPLPPGYDPTRGPKSQHRERKSPTKTITTRKVASGTITRRTHTMKFPTGITNGYRAS
jgi:RHS repeat-associated protein